MKSTNSVLWLGFLLILFPALGVSEDLKAQSAWAEGPIQVDGDSIDWRDIALTSLNKLNIDYGFSNDAKNIYVLFIFKDPKVMSSIGATGLTIWFHPEGKKKNDYGILFIQRNITPDQMIARLEKQRSALSEEEKKEIGANPSYLVYDTEAVGKKAKSHVPSLQGRVDDHPLFRYMKRQNENIFEFRIPMERMNDQIASGRIDPGKNIMIGFQWGGATKEMKEEMMRRSQELDRTSADVGEDMGSREGMSGAEGAARGLLLAPREYKIWMNVDLAVKN